MSSFLTSDLFRNFLGGFAIGAIAMFVLQPDDARALGANAAAASASVIEGSVG